MKQFTLSFHPGFLFLLCFLAFSFSSQGQSSIPYGKERRQRGILLTLSVLEKAVEEFEAVLPAGRAAIRVVIADTLDDFDQYAVRFSGLGVTGIAQPASDLIAVKAPRLREPGADYAGTLRHELIHLLLFRNIGYDRLPQWLNEGLAMFLANEHYWDGAMKIAFMFVRNRIIPYHRLDDAFYYPLGREQFSDAYVQALYMTRQLHKQLGKEKFWKVIHALKEESFGKALVKEGVIDLETLCRGYERNLWKYASIARTSSGIAFQPGAVLLVLAYLRRRRIAKGLYRKWDEEELEALVDNDPPVLSWDEVVEDPDFWKNPDDES